VSSTPTCLLYHLIIATKDREPKIAVAWRERLHEHLAGIARGLGAASQGVGGVADHVHLIVSLKPSHCLDDFMRELKKASSSWVVDQVGEKGFRWQEGYAAFTINSTAREVLHNYLAREEEHHRKKTFREELMDLLKKAGLEYHERYLD
jgi:putative transposase